MHIDTFMTRKAEISQSPPTTAYTSGSNSVMPTVQFTDGELRRAMTRDLGVATVGSMVYTNGWESVVRMREPLGRTATFSMAVSSAVHARPKKIEKIEKIEQFGDVNCAGAYRGCRSKDQRVLGSMWVDLGRECVDLENECDTEAQERNEGRGKKQRAHAKSGRFSS